MKVMSSPRIRQIIALRYFGTCAHAFFTVRGIPFGKETNMKTEARPRNPPTAIQIKENNIASAIKFNPLLFQYTTVCFSVKR